MLDQFKNPDNAVAHEKTTGPELIASIESTIGGERPTTGKIDLFAAGCGSGGTLAGVSRAVKAKNNPDVLVLACDPVSPPFCSKPKSRILSLHRLAALSLDQRH